MIIGLIGRAQAGKSTVADYLVTTHGFSKFALADPLKQMLITAGMITHEEAYQKKTQQSRWLMQKIGTDIFRKQIDPQFWTKKAAVAIADFVMNGKNVVIEDVRFPEEAEMLKKTFGGLLIKVIRIGHIDEHAGSSHESERYIDELEADYTVRAESGDTGELLALVEGIILAQEWDH